MLKTLALACGLSCWLAAAAFPQPTQAQEPPQPQQGNPGNRRNSQPSRTRQSTRQARLSAVPAATFTGTVEIASKKALAIKRDDGNILNFWCTHKTTYTKGSKQIKPKNLSHGELVSVQALPAIDGSLKALAVTVVPAKAPPPASQ